MELTETLLSENQDEPAILTSNDRNDEHITPSQDRKVDALTAVQEEHNVSAVSCAVTDSLQSGGCDSEQSWVRVLSKYSSTSTEYFQSTRVRVLQPFLQKYWSTSTEYSKCTHEYFNEYF